MKKLLFRATIILTLIMGLSITMSLHEVKADIGDIFEYQGFECHDEGDYIAIRGWKGSGSEMTLPSAVNGKPIRYIQFDYAKNEEYAASYRNVKTLYIPDFSYDPTDSFFYTEFTYEYFPNLSTIKVSPNSKRFKVIDGKYLLNKSGTILYYCVPTLTSATIPSTVKKVIYAFDYCVKLKTLTIPKTVTSFDCALASSENQPQLKELIINSNADYTWSDDIFKNVTIIRIGRDVTKINTHQHMGGLKVKKIVVDPANPKYTSVNGAILTKDKSTLITWPAAVTKVKIPATVTKLTFGALLDRSPQKRSYKIYSLKAPEVLAEGIYEKRFVNNGCYLGYTENGNHISAIRSTVHVPKNATGYNKGFWKKQNIIYDLPAIKTELSYSKVTLKKGSKLTLKVINNSSKVTWVTSNKKKAKVSSKGVVRAVSKGKATITATVNGKKYTCKVTVK